VLSEVEEGGNTGLVVVGVVLVVAVVVLAILYMKEMLPCQKSELDSISSADDIAAINKLKEATTNSEEKDENAKKLRNEADEVISNPTAPQDEKDAAQLAATIAQKEAEDARAIVQGLIGQLDKTLSEAAILQGEDLSKLLSDKDILDDTKIVRSGFKPSRAGFAIQYIKDQPDQQEKIAAYDADQLKHMEEHVKTISELLLKIPSSEFNKKYPKVEVPAGWKNIKQATIPGLAARVLTADKTDDVLVDPKGIKDILEIDAVKADDLQTVLMIASAHNMYQKRQTMLSKIPTSTAWHHMWFNYVQHEDQKIKIFKAWFDILSKGNGLFNVFFTPFSTSFKPNTFRQYKPIFYLNPQDKDDKTFFEEMCKDSTKFAADLAKTVTKTKFSEYINATKSFFTPANFDQEECKGNPKQSVSDVVAYGLAYVKKTIEKAEGARIDTFRNAMEKKVEEAEKPSDVAA